MFIAIIGTRSSGKSTVQDYLVQNKGFTPVYLAPSTYKNVPRGSLRVQDTSPDARLNANMTLERPVSFLVMNSPTSPLFLTSPVTSPLGSSKLVFQTPSDLLDFVTRNWLSNFVTLDLETRELLEIFRVRPFFLVLYVDAPILHRFHRRLRTSVHPLTLDEFVQEHDERLYESFVSNSSGNSLHRVSGVSAQDVRKLVHIHLINNFATVSALHAHIDTLNIQNTEKLRPGWDSYFMQLADFASQRSNCMKRRVGAILVRNNRILATGYNGTPRGLANCNEGGCARCNTASETSDECVCLHAEENALLEAGRERVGDGAVLYCNTCPCLKCTIKIIQTGVKEVVYSLSYKVDDASAALFRNAGISIRRHAPPH